ncbi:MAG: formylglycine-generating enzyme family protein [Phycisphaerae bacterium]|nr:formylglycine-generating enzyme family protein [Phycisphaerae bacterium]
MKHGIVIAVLMPLFVVGCAQKQQLKVTYMSDPPGGTLYTQSGELWGPCPKILWYDLDEKTLAGGYLEANGLMVRWPDGPEKKSDKLIRIPVDGTDQQYTFVQPEDEPNAPSVPSPAEKERDVVIQVIPGQDQGLREEIDDRSERIADVTRTLDPIDVAAEEGAVVTAVRSEQDQEQQEQREEEIVQVNATIRTVDFTNGMTMKFALIPAGKFIMDDPSDEKDKDSDAGPTHMVRISKPFYMSVYEVTQQQYEKIIGTNPSRFKGPLRPVETVSWRDAERFCRDLSSLDGGRYRLATEAEWEYACRAGTATAYYWGDDFDDRYAWAITNSKAATHEVGTRLPNAWGLHDMAGNVAEWCEDWYGPYDPNSAEQVDPKGPSDGAGGLGSGLTTTVGAQGKLVYRILRGGSWGHTRASCRSGHRNWHTPDHRYDDCGIRIVMDVPEQ